MVKPIWLNVVCFTEITVLLDISSVFLSCVLQLPLTLHRPMPIGMAYILIHPLIKMSD